mgnify:CR=1 FL=1
MLSITDEEATCHANVPLCNTRPMDTNNSEREQFRRLYPELPDAEVDKAMDSITRYLDTARDIYESVCNDPVRYEQIVKLLKKMRESNP